jgi:UDP-N-acetylglucosamine--N-acetylmuramyl-(pentapeptide) pyrophosphoryl-undecaprenol N-acetylglucosamine transferase
VALQTLRLKIMRIVLAGGGSGGHLFPLVAVAKKLRDLLGSDCELLYVGTGGDLEKDTMEKEGIPAKHVLSGKKRRYFSFQNLIDPLKIPIGIIQSLWILLWFMPDAVFAKGSYASVPVVIAAWIYHIPVLIHESDAVPGTANQLMAKFANRVAASYPHAEQYFPAHDVALTGNPIREGIDQGDVEILRQRLGLTESKPIILVMGGSQGSRIINNAIIKILPQLLQRVQVVHQTGEKNYDDVVRFAAEFGIKAGHDGYAPIKFMDADLIRHAYAGANLVISRAGANSISEIAANGKPAILIPLESAANDHQAMNAYELARVGGALVLEESNLGEHILFDKINKLLDDPELCQNMGDKIRSFYHPEAAEKIAHGLIELAS